MARLRYLVTLTNEAERDLDELLKWSREKFGARQTATYFETLRIALHTLAEDPLPPGSRERGDLARGYFSLHIARKGRRGRHVLIYRRSGEAEILVLRILHDSMDIARHLPCNDEG